MKMDNQNLFRVAIVGAATLKGKELKEVLEERNFPAADVRLLDDNESLGQLEQVYRVLELGDFARTRPRVEEYLASVKNYETNKYELTAEERSEVTRRWGDVIRRYGYEVE